MNPAELAADLQEWRETAPGVKVQESEYCRLLGYPPSRELKGRARELADQARSWYAEHGQPWIFGRRIEAAALANEEVQLGGSNFSAKPLFELFETGQAHAAMVVAVSAGQECEERAAQCWKENKPDEYFFLEMFGSAVIEHLVVSAGGRICAWAETHGMTVLPHYSPGYSGWDIADQGNLWNLIKPDGMTVPGELEVMSTGMLRPKKSLLAVFGLTRQLERARKLARLVPCEGCALAGCNYRRAPYRHALPQTEDVRNLQVNLATAAHRGASVDKSPTLDSHANYSLNEKALAKWSTGRLSFVASATGLLEAKFRYEGTTCSNMGRPLEFEYRVVLGAEEEGYPIREASCAPTAEDTGHQFMCEYLNDGAKFMEEIAEPPPMLGRPLNEVFAWKRGHDPAGCYCAAESRAHKWGLVLEVIHYALARKQGDPPGN